MHTTLHLFFIPFLLFLVHPLHPIISIDGAVVHNHQHEVNKERVVDGAYSPRDKDHFNEDEHHSEFDHEAILGSYKEALEFDNLEPEEAKKRLRILLVKMDLNGDKQIDRNELKAWILRSFKMLSEEESKERLELADENGDGEVTWQEYIADAYGDGDENELSISEEDQHLLASDKIMWQAADVNKDNILEFGEWVGFTHPEEHPAMLPLILEQTLQQKDIDKDGSIDFQEFVGDQAKTQDQQWLKIEKDKFDNDFDKDKDGKLVGNEILSWIVPSNEEIAEDEVEHLFASSDDDHDDILTFDEVVEHHDVFVGSEATDYGDHLHNIYHTEL